MQKIRVALVIAIATMSAVFAQGADKSVYQKDIEALEAQLFPESTQPEAFSKLALPLEGFLIQAIPERNAPMFDKSDVIKSTSASGRNFYYVINPQAESLVKYLLEKKYDLKLYTQLSEDVAKTLAGQVNKALVKSATFVILDQTKTLTEKSIGKDFLYITYGDVKAPASLSLPTGPLYYVFPTFDKMKENKITDPPHNAFFTDDAAAWALERNKVARVFAYLFEANRIDERNFATLKKALDKESQATVYGRGRKYLRGDFSRLAYKWKVDAKAKAVTGCEIVDIVKNNSIKDADLAACEDSLETSVAFKKDDKRPQVISCEIRTGDGKNLLRGAQNLIECIDKSESVRFALEFDSKKCAAFTRDGSFIAFGVKQGCEAQYVILVSEKNKYYFFKPVKGIEKMSRAELMKVVISPPPDRANPFRLFDALDDNWHGGIPLMGCFDSVKRQTMKMDARGELLEACKPDTLYSWGPAEKVAALEKTIGRQTWKTARSLFLTRGPITTFGYGHVPIRVKLKKNVRFVRTGFQNCSGVSPEQANSTVWFRPDGSYSDWTICGAGVIHSWSHDTKEHYDEMVKDYWRYAELKSKGQSHQGVMEFYSVGHQANDIFFNSTIDGRGIYSVQAFQIIMAGLLGRIDKDMEDVIFSPDLPESEKKWSKHFSTDKPVYWNDK